MAEFPSPAGGGRASSRGNTRTLDKRIFLCVHRIICNLVILATHTHMVGWHCSKLVWRWSEMGGKMKTCAFLEALKMPGSLHLWIHSFHNIPASYVLFLPLYSWIVQGSLRNLSKFTELIHGRAIIWILGHISLNPPSFLRYFSACQARESLEWSRMLQIDEVWLTAGGGFLQSLDEIKSNRCLDGPACPALHPLLSFPP